MLEMTIDEITMELQELLEFSIQESLGDPKESPESLKALAKEISVTISFLTYTKGRVECINNLDIGDASISDTLEDIKLLKLK